MFSYVISHNCHIHLATALAWQISDWIESIGQIGILCRRGYSILYFNFLQLLRSWSVLWFWKTIGRQSGARFKQDSRSRTFWCSCYPLGLQDSNWKYLVSFPFSRYSFIKSRSCLVFKQSTWEFIPHLDILEQIAGHKLILGSKEIKVYFWIANMFLFILCKHLWSGS